MTTDETTLKNKKLIEKINTWQAFAYTHPLVCKNPKCNNKLIPMEENLKVILKCPICTYTQEKIPDAVLKTHLKINKRKDDLYNTYCIKQQVSSSGSL